MPIPAEIWTEHLVPSAVLLVLCFLTAYAAYSPARELVRRQEAQFDRVLRRALLIDIPPRTVTILCAVGIGTIGLMVWLGTGSGLVGLLATGGAMVLPSQVLKYLRAKRIEKLDGQLVLGVQNLTAGVRAGLNLVQAMELIARDGPRPIREEFGHLLREYEYGVSLDDAIGNAADRIGSGNYRLVFTALQTHRERGGDLGATLERIADSLREIQRLEKQIRTQTAQGRATARWLGAMPLVILAILYLIVPDAVGRLFTLGVGKLILLTALALNVVSFLWIRRIMDIDI